MFAPSVYFVFYILFIQAQIVDLAVVNPKVALKEKSLKISVIHSLGTMNVQNAISFCVVGVVETFPGPKW